MAQFKVIEDTVRTVDATVEGERVLLDPAALREALGWELKPEGLCRDSVCVPVRDHSAIAVDDKLDLAGVARAVGLLAVVDTEAGVAAIALPKEVRRRALDGAEAPVFTLPDLEGAEHSLEEWRGRKKLLVAFASW